ncbi:MAG: U32 family peptidase [Muribaculaceae bacterium]|nr:U32 family peptidase [Muribaculaceae bacterium]
MKRNKKKELELLAPAANAEVAKEAILHGADAVYIGASNYGARKNAGNSLEDIACVVDFAHQFRAKVYVTVNTILYEDELKDVERLCRSLYRIGVDALIVQDMALLRLDLPPIALHASTQCDIRTPEKAKFLQDVGFSQLVLARELTIPEIMAVTETVDIPVECFVHGALCVSYSGKCQASCVENGRSANRGECAQLCRLPYTLSDRNGKILVSQKHLLSLKDFNASNFIPDLIKAGVSSFKIEGRLKEVGYVKNITSHYDRILQNFVEHNSEEYMRNSFGRSERNFSPLPEKSFNRGFTHYFLKERRPLSIASLDTPKSQGEIITDIRVLHNGDGISFFDEHGSYQGVNVNKVNNGIIIPARKIRIPKNTVIHRTQDIEWKKLLDKSTAKRKVALDVSVDNVGVTATDERGVRVRLPWNVHIERASQKMDYQGEFGKLGNSIYSLRNYDTKLDPFTFIPRSEISKLRRQLIEALDMANKTTYQFAKRRKESRDAIYPIQDLSYAENVSNSLSRKFYMDHGAKTIENALELNPKQVKEGTVVMTTRHCILRELGLCKKVKGSSLKEPLTLKNGSHQFELRFNCSECEMQLLRK